MLNHGNFNEFRRSPRFAGGGGEFRPALVSGVTDTDAQAFFTAAGITDATQKSATNQLVLDLKSASIWTKFHALYPFVGGTAATHKWNLKDPRDLDAAFRIVWNGSLTHNANGVTGDGGTGYGDTKYVPFTNGTQNSTSIGVYSRTNGQAGIDMGMAHLTVGRLQMACSFSAVAGNYFSDHYDDATTNRINVAVPTNSLGLFTDTRTSSTVHSAYRNGAAAFATDGNAAAGWAGTDVSLFILAQSQSGVATNFSSRNIALSFAGLGLTATDVANFYTAVQTFQTTLGRNV